MRLLRGWRSSIRRRIQIDLIWLSVCTKTSWETFGRPLSPFSRRSSSSCSSPAQMLPIFCLLGRRDGGARSPFEPRSAAAGAELALNSFSKAFFSPSSVLSADCLSHGGAWIFCVCLGHRTFHVSAKLRSTLRFGRLLLGLRC